MEKRILVVEDDVDFLNFFRAVLSRYPKPIMVDYASDKNSGIQKIKEHCYSVVVTDGCLIKNSQDWSGVEIAKIAKEDGCFVIGVSREYEKFQEVAGEYLDVNYQKPCKVKELWKLIEIGLNKEEEKMEDSEIFGVKEGLEEAEKYQVANDIICSDVIRLPKEILRLKITKMIEEGDCNSPEKFVLEMREEASLEDLVGVVSSVFSKITYPQCWPVHSGNVAKVVLTSNAGTFTTRTEVPVIDFNNRHKDSVSESVFCFVKRGPLVYGQCIGSFHFYQSYHGSRKGVKVISVDENEVKYFSPQGEEKISNFN